MTASARSVMGVWGLFLVVTSVLCWKERSCREKSTINEHSERGRGNHTWLLPSPWACILIRLSQVGARMIWSFGSRAPGPSGSEEFVFTIGADREGWTLLAVISSVQGSDLWPKRLDFVFPVGEISLLTCHDSFLSLHNANRDPSEIYIKFFGPTVRAKTFSALHASPEICLRTGPA